MCKRIPFNLRTSKLLRLEQFEDRCLLSGVGSLLAPPLLSPQFLEPATILTPVLTQVAKPTIIPVDVAELTGSHLLNGTGVRFNLAADLDLGSAIGASIPLRVAASVNLGFGEALGPNVAVHLDAGLAESSNLNVVV